MQTGSELCKDRNFDFVVVTFLTLMMSIDTYKVMVIKVKNKIRTGQPCDEC